MNSWRFDEADKYNGFWLSKVYYKKLFPLFTPFYQQWAVCHFSFWTKLRILPDEDGIFIVSILLYKMFYTSTSQRGRLQCKNAWNFVAESVTHQVWNHGFHFICVCCVQEWTGEFLRRPTMMYTSGNARTILYEDPALGYTYRPLGDW